MLATVRADTASKMDDENSGKDKYVKDTFLQECQDRHDNFSKGNGKSAEEERRLQNSKAISQILLLLCGVFVILLSMARVDVSWNESTSVYEDTYTTKIISYVVVVLCVMSLVLVVLKQVWKKKLMAVKFMYRVTFWLYFSSDGNIIKCIVEIVIALIHPFWFTSPGNFWLLFCTLFKIYPIIEVFKNQVEVVKKKSFIMQLFRLFGVSFPQFNGPMMVRLVANKHSFLFFGFLIAVMLLVFGYLFFASERPSMSGRKLWMSIYWAAITSATVGYGDITPTKSNVFSMFLACVMAIFGAIVVAMAIGLIINQTTLTPNEKAMLEITNCLHAKEKMRDAAAQVVLKFLQLRKYTLNAGTSDDPDQDEGQHDNHDLTERNLHKDLVDAIYEFTKLRWQVKNRYTLDFSQDIGEMALQMKNVSEYQVSAVQFMMDKAKESEDKMKGLLSALARALERRED